MTVVLKSNQQRQLGSQNTRILQLLQDRHHFSYQYRSPPLSSYRLRDATSSTDWHHPRDALGKPPTIARPH